MAISTTDALLDALAKSTLLEAEQLAQAREAVQPGDDARALVKRLVERGLLTRWQAAQLLAGRTSFLLGKYKLIDLLGHGGMGRVFLARHTMMNRPVALKIISKQLGQDPSNLERFFSEARAVAALNHPNIVHAYNIDNEGDRYYMVMEYVEGEDLQRIVEEDGPLDYSAAVDCIRQAAEGLAHAHSRNIIHCDIKPANLLVNPQGIIKILDMGMARLVSTEMATDSSCDQVLGTVDYMAPELAMQSPQVDRRVDIYSLGCTLYFLLTGHPPFPEGSLTERILKHQMQTAQPIEQTRPDVPAELLQICQKMMAKRPEDRYATADEVAAALIILQPTESPPTPARLLDEATLTLAQEEPPASSSASSRTPAPPREPAKKPSSSDVLDFAEELLPPLEAVSPAPMSAARRRTSHSSIPWLPLLLGGGAVLLLLLVMLLWGLSGPRPSSSSEPKPPTGEPSSPPQPPAPKPSTPPAPSANASPPKPATPASTSPPPAVVTTKTPDKEPKPVEKPAPVVPPTPAASASSDKPSSDKTPAPAASAVAATPEATPEPAPPADPFAQWPAQVALPVIGQDETAGQPVVLGKLATRPEVAWQLELLGGKRALPEGEQYVLTPVASATPAQWLVRREVIVVGTNKLTSDMARLWREEDGTLRFQWLPEVKAEEANYLQNCLLRLRIAEASRDLTLRTPVAASPVTLDLSGSHSAFELKWIRQLGDLRTEILQAEGPSPNRVDPAGPVTLDNPFHLIYSRGDGEPGADFRGVFRGRDGKYGLYFTLQFPQPSTFRPLEKMLQRQSGGGIAQFRQRLLNDRQQVEALVKGAKPDQRDSAEGRLRGLNTQLWTLDFYEAVRGKLNVHFQVFLEVEGVRVILVSTELAPPTPPSEEPPNK